MKIFTIISECFYNLYYKIKFNYRKNRIFDENPESNVKEYKDIEKLIKHLETANIKKLTFNQQEKRRAESLFKTVSYYHFSVYRKLLLDNQKTHSFTDCLEIFEFDNYLKNNLIAFTKDIELWIKTSFTQSLCSNYSGKYSASECYLDSTLYKEYSAYTEVIKILENRINKSKTTIMIHHKSKKSNRFPLWVLTEELTFGEMTYIMQKFKKDIMFQWEKNIVRDRNFVNSNSEINFRSKISSWISSSNYTRNLCAHHSRLYGASLNINRPSFFNDDLKALKKENVRKDQNTTLFAHLLAIKNLLSLTNEESMTRWNKFIEEVKIRINSSPNLHENHIGFINNWESFLLFDILDEI